MGSGAHKWHLASNAPFEWPPEKDKPTIFLESNG